MINEYGNEGNSQKFIYQPLRFSLRDGDPRLQDHSIIRQFREDGIVRACQIGGLLIALRDNGYLHPSDFRGRVVNLGTGSGADIIACRQLGLQATGVDNRSITEGYAVGAWCPIPEFTTSEIYQEEDSKSYLGTVNYNTLSLITGFDAVPRMWDEELAQLVFRKLVPKGKAVLTFRDFSENEDRLLNPIGANLKFTVIENKRLGNYSPAEWFTDLLNYFPSDSELKTEMELIGKQMKENGVIKGKRRDQLIILAEKLDKVV